MEMIRTFIAVELLAEIRDLLADTQVDLRAAIGGAERAVRWSRADGVHLTLQFLGDVPADKIADIGVAMRAGCKRATAAELGLGRVGAFPNIDRPRVLWLRLDGDTQRLQALQINIAQQLERLGYKPDKPFQPHVTLGRVREGVSRDELAAIAQALKQAASKPVLRKSFTADHVSLMKSELDPRGAIYTALDVVELDK